MPSFNAHYHLSHEHRVFAIWEGYRTTNANTTHDSDREQSWTFRNSSASLLLCTLLLVTQCFCYPSFFLPVLPLSQSANANQSILLCHYLYRTCNFKGRKPCCSSLVSRGKACFTRARGLFLYMFDYYTSPVKTLCVRVSDGRIEKRRKHAQGDWGDIYCD
jgi:hypothetical protein